MTLLEAFLLLLAGIGTIVALMYCGHTHDRAAKAEARVAAIQAAPQHDEWYWRAWIAAKDNKHNERQAQGEIARIACMINNPIGDNATMTQEQRSAAIKAVAQGWSDGGATK